MRNFAKVILGGFATACHRNTNQALPTVGQLQEFYKAILCIHSIIYFYFMAQYFSQIDQMVSYLQQYMRNFHETKDVFLRFRRDKKAKKAVAEVYKNILRKQLQVSVADLTMSGNIKMH